MDQNNTGYVIKMCSNVEITFWNEVTSAQLPLFALYFKSEKLSFFFNSVSDLFTHKYVKQSV